MKAATRLFCSVGLVLGSIFCGHAAISGTVKTIGGSFFPGYVDGNNTVSLFNQSMGLAVDSNGRLLVADFNNNAVRFVTPQNETTGTFANSNLNGPIAVAVTGGGDVLVANYNAGNVVRFGRTGTFIGVFANNLAHPTALVIDGSGNVFVAGQAGGVRRYTAAGAFVQSYVVSEGTPEFRGLAITGDGSLAVSDAGNHVIWKFALAGGTPFLTAGTLGSPGFEEGASGFGRLNSPQQLATGPGGVLIVADRNNHRIRAVDPSGLLSTLYGADPAVWEGLPPEQLPGWTDGPADEAQLHDPVGVAVDNSGNVYDSEVFYGVIREASGLSFPTNSVAGGGGTSSTSSGSTVNRISLGFASGEASSDFVASPGQRFTAPITLTLVPGTAIYGLQFNLTVTNADAGTPPGFYAPNFSSMMLKPTAIPDILTPIPPAVVTRIDKVISAVTVTVNGVENIVLITNYYPVLSNLVVTNFTGNFIGVGWLERKSPLGTNLYNTMQQDLIRFSQPHDYTFDGRNGRVVVGAVSFQVPKTAQPGNHYRVAVGRPSATGDGIATDVVIQAPDGSDSSVPVAATRDLNIGFRKYLVGDVVPFRWFNAGDFGDGNILNNDLTQILEVYQETPFKERVYGLNIPPPDSDMFNALDSCCLDITKTIDYSDPTSFAFTDNSTIDKIAHGDGFITLEDMYVTFRRALDPSLVNYERFHDASGNLVAAVTTNSFRGTAADIAIGTTERVKKPSFDTAHAEEPVSASFTAGNIKAGPGQIVHAPVDVNVTGPLAARSVLLHVSVVPLDDTPVLPTSISFTASTEAGIPTTGVVAPASSYLGIWFEVGNVFGAGSHRLGTVDFVIPSGANADTLYQIHIDRAEASAGLTRFPVTTADGYVLMTDRAAAPWTDEIPDAWRIQYFGSLMNVLSAPDADADGDGMTNLEEYRAGTNPTDIGSRFALNGSNSAANVVLKWPSVAGKSYRLESSTALNGAPWTIVEDSIPGTGGIVQREQTFDGGARFYRVHIVQ